MSEWRHPTLRDVLSLGVGAAQGGLAELVSGSELTAVCELADALPCQFLAVGLESRLTPDDGRVDMGICVTRAAAERLVPILSGSFCGSVLAAWCASRIGSWDGVPHSWLEIDRLPHSPAEARWGSTFPFLALGEPTTVTSLGALLHEIDAHSGYEPLMDVCELWSALPRRARVVHLGVLNHRGGLEHRLQARVETTALREWTRESLDFDRAELVERLLEGLPISVVALQMCSRGGAPYPAGLELSYPHGPHGDEVWRQLTSRAVELGLATPEKVRSLLGWSGVSVHLPELSPARLRIHRTFHVTLALTGEPKLKAYTYCYPSYALN